MSKIPSDTPFNTSARVSFGLRGQISICVMPTGQSSIVKALVTAGGGGGVETNASTRTDKGKGKEKKRATINPCAGQEIG